MSTRSLLTHEEIVQLRTNYIPSIHREYKEIIECLNLVAEIVKSCDGDDIYLDEVTQIRILKRIGKNAIDLENAAKDLKLYLRDIAIRLGLL